MNKPKLSEDDKFFSAVNDIMEQTFFFKRKYGFNQQQTLQALMFVAFAMNGIAVDRKEFVDKWAERFDSLKNNPWDKYFKEDK